jgi:hypothetical protein
MSGTLTASLDNAYRSTLAALRDMGYQVENDRMDANEAVIEARDAERHSVKVVLKKTTDRTTDLRIDQGVFTGSASRARLLFDKIRSNTPVM